MKLFILILTASLVTTTGFSQRFTKSDDSLDKKVLAVEVTGPSLLTLEMARELQLTEPQQKEVQQLNEQHYEQLQVTQQNTEPDKYLALQKVHLQHDKALSKVLSAAQLQRFLELEGRQHLLHLSELDTQ
ncbi:MAG TPA: hypothetical protein VIG72_04765 [Pontibacter sp.]